MRVKIREGSMDGPALRTLVGFIVVVCLGFVLCGPVMIIWNLIIPAIFGLPYITFLQAWGLIVLVNFINLKL